MESLDMKPLIPRPDDCKVFQRRNAVERGWVYGKKLGLTNSVIHLSITYYDRMKRDRPSLPTQMEELTILACLRLAAKVDELDMKIPQVQHLNACSNVLFTSSQYNAIEAEILKAFEWRLIIPTIPVFLEYFECKALTPGEAVLNHEVVKTLGGFESALDKMRRVTEYLLKSVIKDDKHHKYKYSQLAAAIIAYTRQLLTIRPKWSSDLKSISGYALDMLEQALEFIQSLDEVTASSYKVSYNSIGHKTDRQRKLFLVFLHLSLGQVKD
jgi:hypothetical protein